MCIRDRLKKEHDTLQVIQQTDCKALETKYESLTKCTALLSVPPYYFLLDNLDHYKRFNCLFRSEPFYSHAGGYKMCLFIYPNGYGLGKDHFLSLYVTILKGEYDDGLHWPFDGQVTVQAYNRATKEWSCLLYTSPSPRDATLSRMPSSA